MVVVQAVQMIKPALLQGTLYIPKRNSLSLFLLYCRLMWRTKGEGEIYAYLPYSNPPKALCGNSLNICNPDYGMSLGRGTFRFAAGKWTHVRQVLTMNTPGKQDGRIVLYANNKKVFTQKNVVFRTNSAGRVSGISKYIKEFILIFS